MINYFLPKEYEKNKGAAFSIKHNNKTYELCIEHFSQTLSRGNPKPHSHPVYHLIYYVTGGEIRLNNTIYSTEPGQLVFISPNIPHSFFSKSDQPYSYFEITFTFTDNRKSPLTIPFGELLNKLFPYAEISPLESPQSAAKNWCDKIESSFLNLPSLLPESHLKNDFGLALSAGLIELLFIVKSALRQKSGAEKSPSRVNDIFRYIHANFQRRITLSDIARSCNGNEQHLNRLFKKSSGKTIMNYINHIRIETAGRMLRSENYTVKEVSRLVGYDDEFYFSRVFKKITGISPSKI